VLPDERARQLDIARDAAAAAGRDPVALEYTRWGAIDMPAESVAGPAAQGVTRLVVAATASDAARRREELSEFAARVGLSGG
jgi:hypothetical protein